MSKEDVDAAFAGWAVDARRLAPTGPDSRALIGALGGVRVLTHLCERSMNRNADVVDDALVALNHLCVDDEAVEDLVCLGGLQVRLRPPTATTSPSGGYLEWFLLE
jgi:hypothetical protein